jgi:hypothetical protein
MMSPVPINITADEDSSTEDEPIAYRDTERTSWRDIVKKYGIGVLCLVVLIVSRSIEFVLFVRIARKMHHYLFLISNILIPLGALIVDVPLLLFQIFVSKSVTHDMRRSPWWKYIVMGILDAIGLMLTIVATAFLTGPSIVNISTTIIIVHIFISIFATKARYNALHIGGALIIAISIGVQITATSQGKTWTTAYQAITKNTWFWMLLLFVANIPIAISNMLKEHMISTTNVDVFYMNARAGFCQLTSSIVMMPLIFIPFPQPYFTLNKFHFPFYITSGLKCFFGSNNISGDNCSDSFALFIAMLFCSCIFHYALLFVCST